MKKAMRRGDPMRYRPWIRWAWYLPRPLRVVILITLAVMVALPTAIMVETFIAVHGAVLDAVRFIKQEVSRP